MKKKKKKKKGLNKRILVTLAQFIFEGAAKMQVSERFTMFFVVAVGKFFFHYLKWNNQL